MLREKDSKLASNCIGLRDATSAGMAWLNDNKKLVGSQFDALKRQLKVDAVEARKLARAAQRPTSLAVFGPSQVGKSVLIGTLLEGSPDRDNKAEMGQVVFGQAESAISLNFQKEINPPGKDETTGLVTRFTVADQIQAPEGFPVCLKLLSEIDLVKIFANTFVHDFGFETEVSLSGESIAALIGELNDIAEDNSVDALVQEDVFELEQYIQNSLRHHPLATEELGDRFWGHADSLAPRLKIQDRVRLFELLWGGFDFFSELFVELKGVLDSLDNAETVFVSLDAIQDRLPGKTILHVKTCLLYTSPSPRD